MLLYEKKFAEFKQNEGKLSSKRTSFCKFANTIQS